MTTDALTAEYWIDRLGLSLHPEGGAYALTHSSPLLFSRDQLPPLFQGPRPAATSIYFLLQAGAYSALHRIASDEIWYYHYGDALLIHEITSGGNYTEHFLGPGEGQQLQCVIQAGSWFGARVLAGGRYTLAGCMVAPGFDFAEFELAESITLQHLFPQYHALIASLTP